MHQLTLALVAIGLALAYPNLLIAQRLMPREGAIRSAQMLLPEASPVCAELLRREGRLVWYVTFLTPRERDLSVWLDARSGIVMEVRSEDVSEV